MAEFHAQQYDSNFIICNEFYLLLYQYSIYLICCWDVSEFISTVSLFRVKGHWTVRAQALLLWRSRAEVGWNDSARWAKFDLLLVYFILLEYYTTSHNLFIYELTWILLHYLWNRFIRSR